MRQLQCCCGRHRCPPFHFCVHTLMPEIWVIVGRAGAALNAETLRGTRSGRRKYAEQRGQTYICEYYHCMYGVNVSCIPVLRRQSKCRRMWRSLCVRWQRVGETVRRVSGKKRERRQAAAAVSPTSPVLSCRWTAWCCDACMRTSSHNWIHLTLLAMVGIDAMPSAKLK